MSHKTTPNTTTFRVGDRVKFKDPQPVAFTQKHGTVVYRFSKHNPRRPRVRWNSGWGTSQLASELVRLTEKEKEELPIPTLYSVDYETPAN